jgi:hypothetical protein
VLLNQRGVRGGDALEVLHSVTQGCAGGLGGICRVGGSGQRGAKLRDQGLALLFDG